ncbi:hypothetical protein HYDPIDRAFT_107880 [Hydnomerulius pinastri MD-312]|nr:hypothetical protein HYDPIDRAFT_107880 [Hydnomerulius pinastri MD-312]
MYTLHPYSALRNLAFFVSLASASSYIGSTDTTRLGPPNALCVREIYNLTVTSDNTQFVNVNGSTVSETTITTLLQTFISAPPTGTNFTAAYEDPTPQTTTGTYSLAGTLCIPLNESAASVSGYGNASVMMLVHGVGFDARYWDFAVGNDESYSFVAAAADAGITTFRYDRLGTGMSEKPEDLYNIVQKTTDVAIAVEFARMLRAGQICYPSTNSSISSANITSYPFNKVVAVGHSYGSIQVQAAAAAAVDAFDGVVLTGYSVNATALPLVVTSLGFTTASLINPEAYPANEYANGYLVPIAPQPYLLNFFSLLPYPSPSTYDPAVFNASLRVIQPVSSGVLYTFGSAPAVAQGYNGSVFVVTGAQDFIFCFGNCYALPALPAGSDTNYTSMLDYVQELFPDANQFQTYLPEATGHLINQHYTAPATYQRIIQFAEDIFSGSA